MRQRKSFFSHAFILCVTLAHLSARDSISAMHSPKKVVVSQGTRPTRTRLLISSDEDIPFKKTLASHICSCSNNCEIVDNMKIHVQLILEKTETTVFSPLRGTILPALELSSSHRQ